MFNYFMPLILLSMCLPQAVLLPISASKMKKDGKKRERETIQQRLLHRCCRLTAPSWLPVWTASLSTLSSTWTQISLRWVMLTALRVLRVTTVHVCLYSCVMCAVCVYSTCVRGSILDSFSLYIQLHLDTDVLYIFMAGDADRTLCACCVLLLCMCACTLAYIFMVGNAASCVCALCATTVHVCMYSVCICVHYVCMCVCVCAICIHAL